jgi:hypothetical protein
VIPLPSLKDLVEFRKQADSTAWTALIAVALICFSAGYGAAFWRYSAVIDVLEQRLKGKEEVLDDYRRRLQIVPAKGGELTGLSNNELKKRSLDFVSDLRKWRTTRLRQESEQNDRITSKLVAARGHPDQWIQITNEELLASRTSIREDIFEYEEKFKETAVMLRDEVLTRLPKEKRVERLDKTNPFRFRYTDYEIPHDLQLGVQYVADSLEGLTKSLD